MSENEIYTKMSEKLKTIKNSINDSIYFLDKFNSNIQNAISVNSFIPLKDEVSNIKEDLEYKIVKITDEMMPEIDKKIL